MALTEDRVARESWRPPAPQQGTRSDALVVETVRRHADQALRIARRYTDTPDDALDAYQRALVQLVRHRDRLREPTIKAWLFEVVRREAAAVREQRRRLVPIDDEALATLTVEASQSAEDRALDLDVAARATEALGALKPDEARALTLQAAGLSYVDIEERLGWSATKVNRALTEGRRRFRHSFAELESGKACLRWAPVIAGRREAAPAERARLRVHLRNCPGCRATARQLHDTSSVLAIVLPVTLAGVAGRPHERLPARVGEGVARLADTLAAGVADRTLGAALKLQAFAEAASAAKLVAVAASAVAVTGGGVVAGRASFEGGRPGAQRASVTARHGASASVARVTQAPLPAAVAGVRATRPARGVRVAGRTAAKRPPREFGGTRSGGGVPRPRGDFAPPAAATTAPSFETVARSTASSRAEFTGSSASAGIPSRGSAPSEFGG